MRESVRQVTKDPVMLRIMDALHEKGSTAKELIAYLGICKNSFDNWKYGSSKSYLIHIVGIADYLGLSIDFLLRGKEMDASVFTAEEQNLICKYRGLSKRRRDIVHDLLDDLAELTETEKQ